MEDLNQMNSMNSSAPESVVSQAPIQKSAAPKGWARKVIWLVVGIIIILLIVLAVLATIGGKTAGDGTLTEEEKASLLRSLEDNPAPEMTKEQRANMVESLEEASSDASELTAEQKQNLLNSLQDF